MVNRMYQQGKTAFEADPSILNPYRERTKRAMWWNRGWMDAEIAAQESFQEDIRDEYPRTLFGAQKQPVA